MASVIDYVTYGQANAHKAIPRLLQSVKFERGDKYDFWIIEKFFYFQVKKRRMHEDRGFFYSCYPNLSTWILVGIVSLSINLSVSYLADTTLDTQVSVDSCNDPRIDSSFNCFRSGNLEHFNCTDSRQAEMLNGTLIHCFKFNRFGVDSNLILAFATTYAVYLVASALFSYIFLLLKVIFYLSHQRLWGTIVMLVGVLMLLFSFVLIVIWFNGYFSSVVELVRLNVINLGQIVMVSLFVFLIGMLMVTGKWVEVVKKRK